MAWPDSRPKRGDLVQLRIDPNVFGVVMAFWDSSVYTPASVDVLVDSRVYNYEIKELDVVCHSTGDYY